MSNKTFLHGDLLLMNVSWASGDLQLYDNQSGFGVSVVFSVINSLILLMAFIVHKAVYKLLARLPNRAINHIIYPSMVSNLLQRRFKKKILHLFPFIDIPMNILTQIHLRCIQRSQKAESRHLKRDKTINYVLINLTRLT